MISFYFKLFLILAFSQGFIFLGIPESHVVRLPAFIIIGRHIVLSLSLLSRGSLKVKILVFLGVELRDNLFFLSSLHIHYFNFQETQHIIYSFKQ